MDNHSSKNGFYDFQAPQKSLSQLISTNNLKIDYPCDRKLPNVSFHFTGMQRNIFAREVEYNFYLNIYIFQLQFSLDKSYCKPFNGAT